MNDPNNYWTSSPSPAPVEFPKTLYHATEEPKRVNSQAEADALGEEWKTEYIPRAFPKMKFRPKADPEASPHYDVKVVDSPEDETKLGAGWSDTPPAEPATTAEPL